MIPDLGKYADTVLWSYVVSIGLLLALILFSVAKGRKVRAEMEQIESRMTTNG